MSTKRADFSSLCHICRTEIAPLKRNVRKLPNHNGQPQKNAAIGQTAFLALFDKRTPLIDKRRRCLIGGLDDFRCFTHLADFSVH